MIKPLQPGFRPWENHTTALAGVGNAPLLVAGATTFPPAGDFILRYALSEGIALRSFIVHCAHPA